MTFKKIFIAFIILILFFSIYNYIQISRFYINRIKLKSHKLDEPLKITQITDFHSNKNINLESLFNEIQKFEPDIIAITGDLIDHKSTDITSALKIFENSKKITDRVYFVIGNHELRNPLLEEILKGIDKYGIILLDDDTENITIGKNDIQMFGSSFLAKEEDFHRIFKDISQDKYNLLLSHSPNRPINYHHEYTDLILTGHTHGGQIRIPIIGPIVAPGQGFFPKYDKGIFELGDTTLYIDSGLGNSALPIRMLNRVQITNITVEP